MSLNRITERFWDPKVPSAGMFSTDLWRSLQALLAKCPASQRCHPGGQSFNLEPLEANLTLVGLCISGLLDLHCLCLRCGEFRTKSDS